MQTIFAKPYLPESLRKDQFCQIVQIKLSSLTIQDRPINWNRRTTY